MMVAYQLYCFTHEHRVCAFVEAEAGCDEDAIAWALAAAPQQEDASSWELWQHDRRIQPENPGRPQ